MLIDHFADRLLNRCRLAGAPVCVGLDPVWERLPAALRSTGEPVEAIEQFCRGVLEAVAEHVPCVKLQLACFERYRAPGVALYDRLVHEAKTSGLIVIADAKRGDIGTSSAHYAAGLLAGDGGADAVTIHTYLGADAMEPFVEVAASEGRGLFALVRTSNPGGDALQSLELADGRTVDEAVADAVAELGSSNSEYLGTSGYSLLGAVVGATRPAEAAKLRDRMSQQIFLVPGYGAQGGTADEVKACFRGDGTGALITASRSVIYAFAEDESDWTSAVRNAAMELKQQIAAVL